MFSLPPVGVGYCVLLPMAIIIVLFLPMAIIIVLIISAYIHAVAHRLVISLAGGISWCGVLITRNSGVRSVDSMYL